MNHSTNTGSGDGEGRSLLPPRVEWMQKVRASQERQTVITVAGATGKVDEAIEQLASVINELHAAGSRLFGYHVPDKAGRSLDQSLEAPAPCEMERLESSLNYLSCQLSELSRISTAISGL